MVVFCCICLDEKNFYLSLGTKTKIQNSDFNKINLNFSPNWVSDGPKEKLTYKFPTPFGA